MPTEKKIYYHFGHHWLEYDLQITKALSPEEEANNLKAIRNNLISSLLNYLKELGEADQYCPVVSVSLYKSETVATVLKLVSNAWFVPAYLPRNILSGMIIDKTGFACGQSVKPPPPPPPPPIVSDILRDIENFHENKYFESKAETFLFADKGTLGIASKIASNQPNIVNK